MRKISKVTVVSFVVLAFAFSSWAKDNKARRSNSILYKLKDGLSSNGPEMGKLQQFFDKYQMKLERNLLKGKIKLIKAYGLLKKIPEEELAAELFATGAVAFAEPDYKVAPSATPNDPYFPNQWTHTKINSKAAWDVTTGSANVKVLVCDTGILATHPDLVNNLSLPGYNSTNGSQNTDPVHYHGTAVAGVLGGVGNNGTGVAGVSWNVSIIPGKITNSSDGWAYYSDMADCVYWGADQGVKVVNLSYICSDSSAVASAGAYLRNKGGLLFVAAGNDGAQLPKADDEASYLLVGATDQYNAKASFSNYGDPIDLVAPGTSMVTTSWSGGYSSASGTSFATPIVAGVAALIYSLDLNFTADQVENFLLSTTQDLGAAGDDSVFGAGLVNAQAAIELAGGGSDPVPDPDPEPENQNPVVVLSATPVSGEAPLDVLLDASGSSDPDGDALTFSWTLGDGSNASGSVVSHIYNSAGSFTATVTVSDGNGGSASDSVAINVQEPAAAGIIHVSAISLAKVAKKPGYMVQADVVVLNELGQPQAGVLVSGTFSGKVTGTVSGVTGADGHVILESSKTKKDGLSTFTIGTLSHPSYAYDETQNVVSSASIGDSTEPPPDDGGTDDGGGGNTKPPNPNKPDK